MAANLSWILNLMRQLPLAEYILASGSQSLLGSRVVAPHVELVARVLLGEMT